MGRRCEQRIEVNLPVRVWGLDQNGNPFLQSAYTVNIGKNGARLRNLFCVAKAGEVVRVQHGLKKANFSIRWIGHPGSQADGQVGLHCMEPEKYIWGVPLPKSSSPDTFQIARQAPSAPARSRAAAASGLGHSKRALGGVVTRDASGQVLRLQQRYACSGTAEVAAEGGAALMCGLADLSISGCYVETPSPLPTYTRVNLRLTVCGAQLNARGTVRNSHAAIGMGISLSEMSNADQRQLHEVIKSLAPDGITTPTPALGSRILTPQSTPVPLLDDELPPKLESREEPESSPPPVDARALGSRLQELSNELEELPQLFSPSMVDPRLLQDFKNALAVARQMASTVQLWMELQSQNRDAFHLLHQIVEERVNIAAEANRHLIAALDASEIDYGTSGLKGLHDSARDLHGRLQKLYKKG